MTNRTAEAMIDKWDGVLATMETGECETCSREFPVDAMTHHEESATSECHQCGQATTGGGELMRKDTTDSSGDHNRTAGGGGRRHGIAG